MFAYDVFMLTTIACTISVFFQTAPPSDYYRIQVVDDSTGRGVPLVELRTVNDVFHVTDSNGLVAFHEPGLMDQKVFFHVSSHGYEFPRDGFGFRGQALEVRAGGSATLKIKRLNIAERLYRVTGAGIYRDSVLLGERPPLKAPLINARVLGSDSVVNVEHKGAIYWFWGDTNRPGYPLGNFFVPGATSQLPALGGLDPDVGVDLDYFIDDTGFAKSTAKMPGPGPAWINGLTVLTDDAGRERLFAHYVRVKQNMETYERGLVEFNDKTKQFEKRVQLDVKAPLIPAGHPFKHRDGSIDYIYFADPYPLVRVRARVEDLLDASRYQGYTCFKAGSRDDKLEIERDVNGAVRFAWRSDTALLTPKLQKGLVKKGTLKAGEGLFQFRDMVSGKEVNAHGGSVYWNEYRRRWIMIFVESAGTSYLGEVWYAEAESPTGPWVNARKIVTHDRYSFYNPKQQPLFDRAGGRFVYFEGTYTHTFSGNPERTPRYDYNQIMYKLDLADTRLIPQ